MKFVNNMSLLMFVYSCFTFHANQLAVHGKDVAFNLGYIQIVLRSTETALKNKLLHKILATTTDFVSSAFDVATYEKRDYIKVATSILAYDIPSTPSMYNSTEDPDDSVKSSYQAEVTIAGQIFFNSSTTWTQENITNFVTSIFAPQNEDAGYHRDFFYHLKKEDANASLPFLTNLTYVSVSVDGDVVNEKNSNGISTDTDGNADNSANDTVNSEPALEVWMIALIGGFGAFLLVLCIVITCICFIPIDDNNTSTKLSTAKQSQNHLGVHTTNPTRSESKMEENRQDDDIDMSPSEAKSIGSQDSSLFTYNPKSVRSYDSKRSYNSYFTYGTQGVEMDVANWHAQTIVSDTVPDPQYDTSTTMTNDVINSNQGLLFDQDISAIEQKKCDLSQIQEDEENESTVTGSMSVASSADVVAPLPLFLPHHSEIDANDDGGSNTVSVTSQSPSRASGKYKSLLATLTHSKSSSTTQGQSKKSIAQQYLVAAAQKDMQNDEASNLIDVLSRDSLSTTSGSESSNHKIVNNSTAQRPLSVTLAVGPPSTIASSHITDPMAIYSTNVTRPNIPQYSKAANHQPSDEESETDSTSSYGPSYFVPQPRLRLGGSATDVLNDLNDLSTQINEIRNSTSSASSASGRAAIRNRR